MKTVSVRQPWAWAILRGCMDVLNRTKRPRYRGPIFLHAPPLQFDGCGVDDMLMIESERRPGIANDIPLPFFNHLPSGGIIGKVEIIDCVTESDSPWFAGPFGLVLANPVTFPDPIPCTGAFGVYEPPAEAFDALATMERAAAYRRNTLIGPSSSVSAPSKPSSSMSAQSPASSRRSSRYSARL